MTAKENETNVVALQQVVIRRRNRLRRQSIEQLLGIGELRIEEERHGQRHIFLVVATIHLADGHVAVLIRGHIAPYDISRIIMYHGFIKRPDGSWTLKDDAGHFEKLQTAIERSETLF
jgi:hypothetical protein